MNRIQESTIRTLVTFSILCVGAAVADEYEIDWYSTDGGGDMFTTGGEYELSGTIGQPDANTIAMTGGEYELSGGFWPGVPAYLLADMNCDGYVNFADVDAFVLALISAEAYYAEYPDCHWPNGDIDGNGAVNFADVDGFVECLINGGCP